LVGSDLSLHVQDALMRVSSDYRAVLVLRHFEGCSYDEIARIIGVPEKTVKSRLFSARRQLKELLQAKGILQ
jgi:RNA polymerase sigma-70 factor (ECF subfamily)